MLPHAGAIVRAHDPDRFLTALFAPEPARAHLFALYGFNHELARAREAVREPMLALIRLQWWREVVEGAVRRHEVATPLAEALKAGALDRADLLAMIDAREAEAEPAIESLADWRAYVLGAAGGVAVAAARLLGAPEPERARAAGAAYGAAGLLRAVGAHARQGRCLLPADVLGAQGLTVQAAIARPDAPAVHEAMRALVPEVERWRAEAAAARVPRGAVAAVLPAVLARRDLRRIGAAPRPRGLGDRLAVLRAGLRGRV
jgi:phytoene synthase